MRTGRDGKSVPGMNQARPVAPVLRARRPWRLPSFVKEDFREIVRDGSELYLRTASVAKTKSEPVYVVSSEPLDRTLMEQIADNLGEITLYGTMQKPPVRRTGNSTTLLGLDDEKKKKSGFSISEGSERSHRLRRQ